MIGRTIPDVIFKTRVRDERIDGENPFRWADLRSAEVFRERRIVLFSLPGAFTPTCTTEQCPAFEAAYDELRALGADDVYCLSVNDAFVMYQWGKHLGLNKLKLLPDGSADFTRRMGMLVKKDHLGFGQRSWRYASVVDDGIVAAWFEEPGINDDGSDDDPYFESSPEKVIDWLKACNDGSGTPKTEGDGALAWLDPTPENSFA